MKFPRKLNWQNSIIIAIAILTLSKIQYPNTTDWYILNPAHLFFHIATPAFAKELSNIDSASKPRLVDSPRYTPLNKARPKMLEDKFSKLDTLLQDSLSANEIKRYELNSVGWRAIAIKCYAFKSLNIALVDSRGYRFDSTSIQGNPGYSYNTYKIDERQFIIILELRDRITDGKWIVEVKDPSSDTQKAWFDLSVYCSKPQPKLMMGTDRIIYQRGDSMEIRTSFFESSKPVLNADVIATIRRMPSDGDIEANAIDTLRLFSYRGLDGKAIADGVYSNFYTNTGKGGEYIISVIANKLYPDSISAVCQATVNVLRHRAQYYECNYGYGKDINADGIFDQLFTGISLNISDPGQYHFSGEMRFPNNLHPGYLTYAKVDTFLIAGYHYIPLVFDGKKLFNNYSGGLLFGNLLIEAQDSLGVEKIYFDSNGYETQKYKEIDFINTGIVFTGNFRSGELDIDDDGIFDSLYVDFETSIGASNEYNWTCTLSDLNNNFIGIDYSAERLQHGINWLRLTFAGRDIFKSRKNGPYIFKNFGVMSLKNRDRGYYYKKVYTNKYRYTDFEKE